MAKSKLERAGKSSAFDWLDDAAKVPFGVPKEEDIVQPNCKQ